jgi:hypothetical protein
MQTNNVKVNQYKITDADVNSIEKNNPLLHHALVTQLIEQNEISIWDKNYNEEEYRYR